MIIIIITIHVSDNKNRERDLGHVWNYIRLFIHLYNRSTKTKK